MRHIRLSHLVDVVQFRTGSPSVVGFFSEPLGADFDPAAAGLTAARPVGPLTQFTVRRTRDDARLLDVPWNQSERNRLVSGQIQDPLQAGNPRLEMEIWATSLWLLPS